MVDAGWAHDLVTVPAKGAAQLALIIMKMDGEMAALMMIVKVDNFDRHFSSDIFFNAAVHTKTLLGPRKKDPARWLSAFCRIPNKSFKTATWRYFFFRPPDRSNRAGLNLHRVGLYGTPGRKRFPHFGSRVDQAETTGPIILAGYNRGRLIEKGIACHHRTQCRNWEIQERDSSTPSGVESILLRAVRRIRKITGAASFACRVPKSPFSSCS